MGRWYSDRGTTRKELDMNIKEMEFLSVCGEYLIEPELVLELDDARDAIRNSDWTELARIIESEF